ncbi:glycosyltransferase [Anaerophaga thermohalophila]|uniref:glycosyltransferase n=1 Tax=Anaerophaga thermohalophila TaxID=177400 RepID=UPI00031277B6|nr:glycosyltransferase [Anaerophaga thermohalophila]
MQVSIIIVNYNTKKLTIECINSIIKHTKDITYEIVLVDNNSTDDSVQYFKKLKGIKLIESRKNLGFGGGNNLGVKNAIGKYILLLNPDTILLNNAVKLFYDYMESTKDNVGVIGCNLLDSDGAQGLTYVNFKSIKNHLKFSFNILCKKLNINLPKRIVDTKAPYDVDGVLGADMFMKKELFTNLNGFDTSFFLYVEEVELQKRIADKNYLRRIIPGPLIIHLEGGSSNKNGKQLKYSTIYCLEEGTLRYIHKHYSKLYYFLFVVIQFFTWLPWILVDKRFSKNEKMNLCSLLVKKFNTAVYEK